MRVIEGPGRWPPAEGARAVPRRVGLRIGLRAGRGGVRSLSVLLAAGLAACAPDVTAEVLAAAGTPVAADSLVVDSKAAALAAGAADSDDRASGDAQGDAAQGSATAGDAAAGNASAGNAASRNAASSAARRRRPPVAPQATPVRAEPLWEAGVGMAALTLPDYRGSDERRQYLLPFPYIVYRGKWLRVDRDGLRAKLFDDERFDLEFSGSINFALRANENRAREGMPELRNVGEAGPELVFHLVDGRRAPVAVDLRLATRAAFAIGAGRVTYAGYVVQPSLRLGVSDVFRTGFDGTVSIGPIYGSRQYHDYYYGVATQYATADRPAYEAKAGYAGLQLSAGSSRRFGDLWIGAYVRYDSLRGAAFEDSPLVKTRSFATAGIALAWVLGKSQTQVERPR